MGRCRRCHRTSATTTRTSTTASGQSGSLARPALRPRRLATPERFVCGTTKRRCWFLRTFTSGMWYLWGLRKFITVYYAIILILENSLKALGVQNYLFIRLVLQLAASLRDCLTVNMMRVLRPFAGVWLPGSLHY